MRHVTGIVLCASVVEEHGSQGEDGMPALFERINAWLFERDTRWVLNMAEDTFGGNKHPEMFVAGGGFNYFLPEREFVFFVMVLPWQCPENVILIIQPQDGPTKVHRPKCP